MIKNTYKFYFNFNFTFYVSIQVNIFPTCVKQFLMHEKLKNY